MRRALLLAWLCHAWSATLALGQEAAEAAAAAGAAAAGGVAAAAEEEPLSLSNVHLRLAAKCQSHPMTPERAEEIKIHVEAIANAVEDETSDCFALDLSFCLLQEFPVAEVCLLAPNVRHLNLAGNLLETIPAGAMHCLDKLSRIDLSRNIFQELPEELCASPMLRQVKVSNNMLSTFPTQLEKCPKLRHLIINANFITTVPEDLGSMFPDLRLLNMADNELCKLPESILTFLDHCKVGVAGNSQLKWPPLWAALKGRATLQQWFTEQLLKLDAGEGEESDGDSNNAEKVCPQSDASKAGWKPYYSFDYKRWYWTNLRTGETTWEAPPGVSKYEVRSTSKDFADGAWSKLVASDGSDLWLNLVTKQFTFERPEVASGRPKTGRSKRLEMTWMSAALGRTRITMPLKCKADKGGAACTCGVQHHLDGQGSGDGA